MSGGVSSAGRFGPGMTGWRREALRTNLWLVPTIEVVVAVGLFALTHVLDRAAYNGQFSLPSWVVSGDADAARQILTAIAAAVITVVGLVFSIMIVTLTLASTQFGPRMLRNFIRDRGTQLTLGTFVATFVYAVLVLVSVGPGSRGEFVPHISVTVTLLLVVVDLAVLIFFIDHIAKSIQLPQVIASIARDLSNAIASEVEAAARAEHVPERGPSVTDLSFRLSESGGIVPATSSGYLQFVRYDTLIAIASRRSAVIRLLHRPGHFVVQGHPLAEVLPAEAAPEVARSLERAHATGSFRTLTQDLSFAIDQMVEIGIRALSPAVNDTFTALTCVDWLGESLARIAPSWRPVTIHRDREGRVRVITAEISFVRLVERSFEKIRQASRGMPAVMIRQLDALRLLMETVTMIEHRDIILDQAGMIMRGCTESVPEERDRADVARRFEAVCAASISRFGGPRGEDRDMR
jgi:uncharacterized membrane protein